jgi:hypothetical protein
MWTRKILKLVRNLKKNDDYRRVIKRVCQSKDLEENFFLEREEIEDLRKR